MLVSVIIPCYNQAHFLRECIASLQAQTYPHWEAIVVDDGSPDDTAALAKRLADEDSRVRLIRKKNGGLSSARNAGLESVRGEFVQFLDADDLLVPTKFQIDLRVLEGAGQHSISISDYLFQSHNGTRFSNNYTQPRFLRPDDVELEMAVRWESDLSIPVHCVLVNVSLLRLHDIQFSEQLPNHEDWEFWMRIFSVAPTIKMTEQVGAIYRVGSGSMSRNAQAMFEGFMAAIRMRQTDPHTRPVVRRALKAKRALTTHYYQSGWRPKLKLLMQTPLIRRHVPWPIQRAVPSTLWLDLPDHIAAINERFLGVRRATT